MPDITPTLQTYDTPNETQKTFQQQKTQDQQTQQQPQNENNPIQPTEHQPANPKPQIVTTMTTPLPTLTPLEKQTLSHEEQQSFLYWTGLVDVGATSKKRR